MSRPRPGEMDQPITIRQKAPADEVDTSGAPKDTWTTFSQTFAKVDYLTQAEVLATRGFHSISIARFKIRNVGTPDETMEIDYANKVWRVIGIAEIERGWGWNLLAEVVK